MVLLEFFLNSQQHKIGISVNNFFAFVSTVILLSSLISLVKNAT